MSSLPSRKSFKDIEQLDRKALKELVETAVETNDIP